jgi:hypothetical protein
MVSLRRTTLVGRSAKRLMLAPLIGLALLVGASQASAATPCGKAHGTVKKAGGRSADHRPAGAGSGRRIR